jgi:hypothetical protein
MYGQSFKDRIAEHKGSIIRWVAIVGIAAIISAIMVMALAVDKGIYTKGMDRAEAGITAMGSKVADIQSDVDGILARGPLATSAELTAVGNKVLAQAANISEIKTRMDSAEMGITTLQQAMGSPPEGYLTGTFGNSTGNYTLHAKCSEAGNFTANINLVYSAPVSLGNTTTYDGAMQVFYGSVNWTAANTTVYVPTLAYNSTAWRVSKVQFSIGVFPLTANNETAIPVVFSGLNATYEPNFAYVEIYPALK